ncbi:MAG: N-formylglutamate amidohydrolase [Gammaproteobacteria bacterium]
MAFAEHATATDECGEVINAAGAAPLVLVCEHATNHIPAEFGNLGLDAAALESHIAWDPGALAVARRMSKRLDAPLVVPGVSRLLHDVNRPAASESACPATSEIYEIPGNRNLTEAERQKRAERFYFPFHRRLESIIEGKLQRHPTVALVTIHSFVPVFHGAERTMDLGIIHDADGRIADRLLEMGEAISMRVARNAPYGPGDGVTHTLAKHAVSRGLPNVMLEIRNDLIATEAGQERLAAILSQRVREALSELIPAWELKERSP